MEHSPEFFLRKMLLFWWFSGTFAGVLTGFCCWIGWCLAGLVNSYSDEPRKFSASQARRPAFAQHCAREGNSERELAQVESTVCFQRKLSSERA